VISNSRPEPRFDRDYEYGRQGELCIATFLEWIANGDGRVEVKRKGYLDLNFYIETHCDKQRCGVWTPSGISTSLAEAYAFVIDHTDIALILPTDDLRQMFDDPTTRDRACDRGDYPTRGKLINLGALLYRHKQRIAREKKEPIK
jgi:hypothetical protein